MSANHLILSLGDFLTAARKNCKFILMAGCIGALALFLFRLQKPVVYTAEADFKRGSSGTPTTTMRFLESLSGITHETSYEDPKFFLSSYPVLKRVVQRLELQGAIREMKKENRWTHYRNIFIAEWSNYRFRKKKRPYSEILDGHIAIPDRIVLADHRQPVKISHIIYSLDVFKTFQIVFNSDDQFSVFEKRKKIGDSTCGTPFSPDGSIFFTLTGLEKNLKGRCFELTLIPLYEATRSLENSVSISPVKKNPSLIHIAYRHADRRLAAAIINTLMEEFSHYLEAESEKKIQKQLNYLEYRQNKAIESFEGTLEQYKQAFQDDLAKGSFITLEKEIEFMAKEQARSLAQLEAICQEMQDYRHAISERELSHEELIAELRERRSLGTLFLPEFEGVDLKGAKKLLLLNQEKLDRVQLDKANYAAVISKLEDENLDCGALAKILEDESLKNCFQKLHTISRRLLDVENWSEKELLLWRRELDTEKRFLNQYTLSLIESANLQEKVLNEKIPLLQIVIMGHLLDKYEAVEWHLKDLSCKLSHFPEKWLTEQKIELSKKMHVEIIETIMKSIEAKNISYHMEYINSLPLNASIVPSLPDKPKLAISLIAGFFVGATLALILLILKEVFAGPSASALNLQAQQLCFAGSISNSFVLHIEELKERDLYTMRQTLRLIGDSILVLVTSELPTFFALHLATLLSKQGKKILLVDLTIKTYEETGLLDYLSNKSDTIAIKRLETGYSLVSLGSSSSFKEELLSSCCFEKCLQTWKNEFDQIILWNQDDFSSITTQKLSIISDKACCLISDQRLKEFAGFSKNTIFINIFSTAMPLLLDSIRKQISSSFSEELLESPANKP